MNCRDTQSLIGDYALGLLDEEQRLAIEEHMEQQHCSTCRHEYEEVQQALAALIDDGQLLSPPERLKETIVARIADTQVVPAQRTGSLDRGATPRQIGTLAVAAGLAAVVLGWGISRWSRVDDQQSSYALQAWRQQIKNADEDLGLVGTHLVSLPLGGIEHKHLAYAVVDQVSGGVHVWTRSTDRASGEMLPNHAWLMSLKGEVLGQSHLSPKGDRLAAVVTAAELRSGPKYRLLLTHEDNDHAETPSAIVLDSADLILE